MKLIPGIFLFFIFSACSSKQEKANDTSNAGSTTEKNKELVKLVYSEMAGKQNYALIDSFFAPVISDHSELEAQQQGREGFKKAVTEFLGMFSQIEIKVEDMIAERDFVSSRETWKVTMAGTSKVLTGETMHWFRIKDGRITDEWSKGWEWLRM